MDARARLMISDPENPWVVIIKEKNFLGVANPMIQIQIALIKLFLVFILIHFNWSDNKIKKPKRDIRDYTDADIGNVINVN